MEGWGLGGVIGAAGVAEAAIGVAGGIAIGITGGTAIRTTGGTAVGIAGGIGKAASSGVRVLGGVGTVTERRVEAVSVGYTR